MQLISTLMENEAIQKYVTEQEALIVEASGMLGEFPQVVKDYIIENLSEFVGDTPSETYENMVQFTESAVNQFMTTLVENIVE